jgi:3-isopropylmalate dehydrogenase
VKARIVLLPGDGIGPEVVDSARRVLEEVAGLRGHTWSFATKLIGGEALRQNLPPLPDDTLAAALAADAVLLGAVGDPAFDKLPPSGRPESALLRIRRELGVFANLRPARAWPGLEQSGPLKPDVLAGTDLVVVRELLGRLITASHAARQRGVRRGSEYDVLRRDRRGAWRSLARKRRRELVSVDKANVLEVSNSGAPWSRDGVSGCGAPAPVGFCAMKLALAPALRRRPHRNMFGDIPSWRAGCLRLARPSAGEPRSRTGLVRAGARIGSRYRRSVESQSDRRDRFGGDAAR